MRGVFTIPRKRHYRYAPKTIKMEEVVKMKGHNLKGRKPTLNPVKTETSDRVFSIANESQYMVLDMELV
jgi:hypothetical protein